MRTLKKNHVISLLLLLTLIFASNNVMKDELQAMLIDTDTSTLQQEFSEISPQQGVVETINHIPSGAGSSVNCDLPGNNIEGYCRLKLKISTSSPLSAKAFASLSLNVDMPPPRRGCAGPIITIFFTSGMQQDDHSLSGTLCPIRD